MTAVFAAGEKSILGDMLVNFAGTYAITGDAGIAVSSVEYDSRRIQPGSLFVAVEGYSSDGHGYIDAVADAGASAVVVAENRSGDFAYLADRGISVISVSDCRRALSRISAAFYGFPSRDMIAVGITGTNGKTSITYMLEAIAVAAGYNPGVIGTIDYRWKGTNIPAPNTTPESRDLQEILFRMRRDGVDFLIMEVSSHGLELNRADDVDFDIGVFTNLTRDHLDFHKDFDAYFTAKKRLFDIIDSVPKAARTGLVNIDDPYGRKILDDRASRAYPLLAFGLDGGDFSVRGDSIINSINGISYTVDTPGGAWDVKLNAAGRFNVYNSLAAFAAARSLGIDAGSALKGLASMETVPGRFDAVPSGLGFHVVVDYAHTDDALRKLLQSARELNPARLITVFGCGGNRDRTKRPLMGAAATELSDHVIVTSDNPRKERPEEIINDILAGISKQNVEVNPDRKGAIGRAIEIACEGDIVIIAGKGHEDYQIIGETKIHFDDKEIASEFIAMRKGR